MQMLLYQEGIINLEHMDLIEFKETEVNLNESSKVGRSLIV